MWSSGESSESEDELPVGDAPVKLSLSGSFCLMSDKWSATVCPVLRDRLLRPHFTRPSCSGFLRLYLLVCLVCVHVTGSRAPFALTRVMKMSAFLTDMRAFFN